MRTDVPGRFRRAWPAHLGLVVGAVLVAVLAAAPMPASAAPTLTVSPASPMPPDPGKSTAAVTFTWAGVPPSNPDGGPIEARLVVDAATVKSITTATASHGMSLGIGTHAAQLVVVEDRRSRVAATLQVVVTERPGTPTPPACPDTCFKSLKVTPHGTYATFDVETLAPTKIGVAVYSKPADSKGNFPPGSLLTGAAGASAAKHTLDTFGVIPANTEHFYEVIATAGNGATFKKLGSFMTLKRQVEVGFKSIYIDDDSDGGSEGDLTFTFSVNGQYKTIWAEADTGETVALLLCPEVFCALAHIVVTNAPATTGLAVLGKDDDTADLPWPQNDYCLAPSGPPYFPSSGAGDDCDWNTVEAHAHHNSHKGPNEAYTVTFSMKADNSSALRFTVTVMLKVSYA